MGALQRWLHTASPLSKTLMAISATTAFVVGYKYFYAPYARRQRYKEAEEWANFIIEQEEREVSQGNYKSY